jgi:hypothetical protein
MQTAIAFLREIPDDQVKNFSSWIQDPDVEFARQVFIHIANRDKKIGSELALKHFHKANPQLKQSLLLGFKFSREGKTIPQKEVDFISEIAASNTDANLRSKAIEKLRFECREPSVWNSLLKLKDDSTLSEKESSLILETLIIKATSANPEGAVNFLRKVLSEEQKKYAKDPENFELKTVKGFRRSTQLSALSSLLRKADNPAERAESVGFIYRLTTQYSDDEQLGYLTILGLQQSYASKAFDWSQDELVAIVKRASKASLAQTRFYACKIAGDALKKATVPDWKEILEAAKTNDPHPEIRRYAEAQLNGKNHFVNPSKL